MVDDLVYLFNTIFVDLQSKANLVNRPLQSLLLRRYEKPTLFLSLLFSVLYSPYVLLRNTFVYRNKIL